MFYLRLSSALLLCLGSWCYSGEIESDIVAPTDIDDAGFAALVARSDSEGAEHQNTEQGKHWIYGESGSGNAILRVPFRLLTRQGQLRLAFQRSKQPATAVGHQVAQQEIIIGCHESGDPGRGLVAGIVTRQEVSLYESENWNVLELVCIGSQCDVALNGYHLGSVDLGGVGGDVIGIISSSIDDRVEYGNVRYKRLPDDATDYHNLFDGKSLEGWNLLTRTGGFLLNREESSLTTKGGGLGLLWYPRQFRDFVLMLDWKVSRQSDNSGVYLRFPDPSDDPWVVAREGYEIQIDDSGRSRRRTGSIFGQQDAPHAPTKPVGQWNHLEVLVRGQNYIVIINGQQVLKFTGNRNTTGHVGLQHHNSRSRVSFRNIRLVELGD